jgi:flagellar basal-body rod modification protein FlgD
MAVTSAITPTAATTGNTATAATSALGKDSIAQNFTTFLQLLTTQLQNQNPLDPLDTNQFTQQLVQFAQVEQQMNMNASLTSLISLQKAAQTSAALGFLGSKVVVDGDTAQLSGGKASWSFTTDRPASAVINVSNATGQVVYTESRTVTAGAQTFTWNGLSTAGQSVPDGNYKISIVAKDANGQLAAIATEVEGTVDGVDLNETPPVLKLGTRSFALDKIKQVRRQGS